MKNPYDCTGHIELNRNKNIYYLASNNLIISCTNFSFFTHYAYAIAIVQSYPPYVSKGQT